ncbi:hypothetical protein [Bradyrhizobium sp. Ce-3]|uniref:hypothetical protein n=1 Tax=Bradyrhizobium sp. Ce-3 TaxID=2913970 RepID=UPI001FBBA93A|nr:hypothetical protein [Bradyrhizobium sp. Ce-3]GKQ51222.1 hypothetical protein BRSPCE3_20770 [Bradyrhizobium sp. Ce-3]
MFTIVEEPCSHHRYNDLPDVAEAFEALRPAQRRLDQLVASGTRVCAETPFARGELGAFLLHRHWDLRGEESIIERPGIHPTGRPALIAQAERLANDRTAAPSRFLVDAERRELTALEFSSDKAVTHAWAALVAQPALLQDICSLVADSGLSNQVGLAILARAVSVPEGQELVEENWSRMSVTSAQPLPVADENLTVIPTGWAFISKKIQAAGSCIAYCMSAGSSPHCVHHYNRPPQVKEQ